MDYAERGQSMVYTVVDVLSVLGRCVADALVAYKELLASVDSAIDSIGDCNYFRTELTVVITLITVVATAYTAPPAAAAAVAALPLLTIDYSTSSSTSTISTASPYALLADATALVAAQRANYAAAVGGITTFLTTSFAEYAKRTDMSDVKLVVPKGLDEFLG